MIEGYHEKCEIGMGGGSQLVASFFKSKVLGERECHVMLSENVLNWTTSQCIFHS